MSTADVKGRGKGRGKNLRIYIPVTSSSKILDPNRGSSIFNLIDTIIT